LRARRDIREKTFRAQYDGYRSVKGVAPRSHTETFFRVEGALAHPRWRGVPVVFEAGKRLAGPKQDETTEIEMVLRHPQPCLCGEGGRYFRNKIIFHQDPKESITIQFWSKKPGHDLRLEERTFKFEMHRGRGAASGAKQEAERSSTQYVAEYEKLI